MYLKILVFFIVSLKVASLKDLNCDNRCHPTKDGFINIHIIPHTHNDVGWIKTVDEYYRDDVRRIINSVVQSLKEDSDRRFIYAESAFLFKWWNEQNSTKRSELRRLINNGQLELVGGGWSSNDEATTHFQSIIDQFTYGLRKINDTFGKCGRPSVGWQIDSFGHSKEMASIFGQLGFDGLFLGRIDYQDKLARWHSKRAEMVWKGIRSSIFTHVLYDVYWPPIGLCFDTFCTDEDFAVSPIVSWDTLRHVANSQAKIYKTSNIIMTMGGDFHYSNANSWFGNLDTLIRYGNVLQNNGSKYHLLYSTPSCYLKAVREEIARKNTEFPGEEGDFFPYAMDRSSYWTGYYTSRPTLKRYERIGNNFLQVCKQLFVLAKLGSAFKTQLDVLQEAMGVMQHHDAITGTEKQAVADDYVKTLTDGLNGCSSITKTALNTLSLRKSKKTHAPYISFTSCLLGNISQCELTENNDKFTVTIYNPLSRAVDYYVRLPVRNGHFVVLSPSGKSVPTQLVPIHPHVLNVPGRTGAADFDLVFAAQNLPPLGFNTYHVTKRATFRKPSPLKGSKQKIYARLSRRTGHLIRLIVGNTSIPIKQEFLHYVGDGSEGRVSGAYIFNPDFKRLYKVTNNVTNRFYAGDVVREIHQTFNSQISQVVRIYPNESYVELNWLIGSLPNIHWHSNHVITRYTTLLDTDYTFYTDSNGREMMKRVKNFRPSWNLTLTQPISSNYYPVTTRIAIRDPGQGLELAVLTDRAQGGTSLINGQIELMLHRSTIFDDHLGVGESLREHAFGKPLVVRGSHYLVANLINNSIASIEKDVAQRKLLEAWTFVSKTDLSYQSFKKLYKLEYSGLNRPLPKNVQILTLEPIRGRTILLRLEHAFEKDEDFVLSRPAVVNLGDLFAAFKVISVRETTLGGNQWLDENDRMDFTKNLSGREGRGHETKSSSIIQPPFSIHLEPMQIRTFVVFVGTFGKK